MANHFETLSGFSRREQLIPRQAAQTSGFGLRGEDKFAAECKKLGYQVIDRRKWAKFDFLVNGKAVEVKSSTRRIMNKTRFGWNFTLEYNLGHFDFAACYCHQRGTAGSSFWIVLPKEAIEGKTGFCFFPEVEKNANKYVPFIDRFDLLV